MKIFLFTLALFSLCFIVSCAENNKSCEDLNAVQYDPLQQDTVACRYSSIGFYYQEIPARKRQIGIDDSVLNYIDSVESVLDQQRYTDDSLAFPYRVFINGTEVGKILSWHNQLPAHCDVPGLYIYNLPNGDIQTWYAVSENDPSRTFSGTIQSKYNAECIIVRVN